MADRSPGKNEILNDTPHDDDKPVILVVEDDPGLRRQFKWSFDAYRVVSVDNRQDAIAAVAEHRPSVMTLDLGLPPDPDGVSEGFATLQEVLTQYPHIKILVASGQGAPENALKAISLGAYDFYRKPVNVDEMAHSINRAFHVAGLEQENRKLQEQTETTRIPGLITAAPEMLKVCENLERVSQTNASVILLGASGTGKEILARGLHHFSPQKDGPFIAINCGAIPENLLESELFGYEKGAFTGAVKTTPGKIEQAHNGTLFLDEIGDIPFQLQVKLLRFLQERSIERIGGRKLIPVDTRVVCATHRNLEEMIETGTFREDLFYRISEIVIEIPKLFERPGDAVLIAHHFLNIFNKDMRRDHKGFDAGALKAIQDWSWPGNVRELENKVKRAVIMAPGPWITHQDLDLDLGLVSEDTELNFSLKGAREIADRKAILLAITHSNGNISNCAKLLGISRPTLYDLAKQYKIELNIS